MIEYKCNICDYVLDDSNFIHKCRIGPNSSYLSLSDFGINDGCHKNENEIIFPYIFYTLFESVKIKFELDSSVYDTYYIHCCMPNVYYHCPNPIGIPKNLKSQVDFNNFLKREVNKVIKRIKLAEYEL